MMVYYISLLIIVGILLWFLMDNKKETLEIPKQCIYVKYLDGMTVPSHFMIRFNEYPGYIYIRNYAITCDQVTDYLKAIMLNKAKMFFITDTGMFSADYLFDNDTIYLRDISPY
jgi:hypothetical protein